MEDYRKKKIAREFDFFDTNKDGALGWIDFEIAGRKLALAMGWGEGTEAHAALLKLRRTAWEEICLSADFDESDHVNLEEYLAFYTRLTADMGTDPQSAKPWFKRVCAAHIESMDLEGTGQIDLEGYERFTDAHGASFDTGACFARLDIDGNGVLDHDEAVLLSLQFYLSDDPSLPGNWIWGPV